MARIPLPTRETLATDDQRERWDRLAADQRPMLNVRRLLLINPAIATSNGIESWKASGLAPRARELVILRCAYRKDSRYEWHQHVRIARAAGVPDAGIDAVRNWRDSSLVSEDERALLAYVDALADGQRPDDAAFAAMSRGRTAPEVFGVTYLITVYFQLAQIMATFDLETEEPFVGWEILAR
jgi:alkylhydroperoxidase family enzyme